MPLSPAVHQCNNNEGKEKLKYSNESVLFKNCLKLKTEFVMTTCTGKLFKQFKQRF